MERSVMNFGGNLRFTPTYIHALQTEAELLQILSRHRGQEIRARGSLHAWSEAAGTDGVLIDLQHLNSVKLHVAGDEPYAEVGAGCQIKHLLDELQIQGTSCPDGGFTLPSLGLIFTGPDCHWA